MSRVSVSSIRHGANHNSTGTNLYLPLAFRLSTSLQALPLLYLDPISAAPLSPFPSSRTSFSSSSVVSNLFLHRRRRRRRRRRLLLPLLPNRSCACAMATTLNMPSSSADMWTSTEHKSSTPDDLENGGVNFGATVATSSVSVRLAFIRKVYGILAAQLALTIFTCALFMFVTPLRNLAIAGQGVITIISIIGTFASLFALIAMKDNHPTNLQLLAVFTLFESILVGTVCARYAASGLSDLVLEALVITLTIFAGLTAYAFWSKRDFSFLGAGLFVALIALLGCSFINLFLGVTGNKSPMLALLISWGGSVLFSLYILYDSKFFLSFFFLSFFPL